MEVDSLSVRITTTSDVATQGLNRLDAAMSRLTSQNTNLNRLSRSVQQVSTSTSGLTTATTRVNAFATALHALGIYSLKLYALRKVFTFLKESVTAASDLVEAQNVVATAFGNLTDKAEKFASTANVNYGLSELQAKQYSSTYMAAAVSMGIAQDAAADMSLNLTALAGDIASFYNIDHDTAAKKLQSVFTRQTKPLQNFGANISVANLQAHALSLGIDKSWKSMTQAEKTMLSYSYVMDFFSMAQGDFTRTSHTWANQVRLLSINLENLKVVIGQGLTAALRPFLVGLNTALDAVVTFGRMVNNTFASVFGATASLAGIDMSGLTEDMDSLVDSENAAASSAKALKRELMGFDEINKLSDHTSSSVGSSGLSDLSSFIYDTSSDATGEVTGVFKKLQDWLNGLDFNPLQTSWDKLKEAGSGLVDIINGGLNWGLENVLAPLGKWTIEEGLPALIRGLAGSFELLASSLEMVFSVLDGYDASGSGPLARLGHGFVSTLDSFSARFNTMTEDIDAITAFFDGEKTFGDMLAEWFDPESIVTSINSAMKVLNLGDLLSGKKTIGSLVVDIKPVIDWTEHSKAAALSNAQAWDTHSQGMSSLFDGIVGAFEDFFNWLKSKLANTSLGKMLGITVDEAGTNLSGKTTVTGKGTITADVELERTGPQVFNEFKYGWNATGRTVGVTAGLSNTASGLANQFEEAWTKVSPTVTVNNKLKTSGSTLGSNLVKEFGTPLVYVQPAVTKKLTKNDLFDLSKKIMLNWTPENGHSGLSTALQMGSISFAARGGIVDSATLFGNTVVGEAGREAIIPLENHTEWMDGVAERIASKIAGAVPAGSGEYNINVTVELDKRVVGQTTVKYIQDEARAGNDPLGAYI